MTADKNPLEDAVEQALDAFVYAPIGLLFDGPAAFPKLVRNGRSQVTNARMMGQFAVQMGRTEVERRAADLDGPVVDLLRGLGVVPGPTVPAPTPTEAATATVPTGDGATKVEAKAKAAPAAKAAKKATAAASKAKANSAAAKKAAAARTAATDAATPSAAVLPIPDYDSLSASQVVSRLRGLSTGQLEAVRAYESATRGRKTILNRVQQLSKT